MKYKKTVYPQPFEQVSRTTCDGCGRTIVVGSWDATEIVIEARIGDAFPEVDCRDTERADCCAQCWRDKVRPALIAAGFKLYKYDTDGGQPMASIPFDEAKDA